MLWGIYSKASESGSLKDPVHSHVHCSIIHHSQEMETSQIPTNKSTEEENAAYTYMDYYNLKKGSPIICCNLMNLEDIMLNQRNQKQVYILYDYIYMTCQEQEKLIGIDEISGYQGLRNGEQGE